MLHGINQGYMVFKHVYGHIATLAAESMPAALAMSKVRHLRAGLVSHVHNQGAKVICCTAAFQAAAAHMPHNPPTTTPLPQQTPNRLALSTRQLQNRLLHFAGHGALTVKKQP
jgi:hypothetical protein